MEDPEGALPVSGLGILQDRIDDLERPSECNAQRTGDVGQLRFGLAAEGQRERRPRGQRVEHGLEPDLRINFAEHVKAFLQTFTDRQTERFDDLATVRLRRGLAADQKIIGFLVDEFAVAMQIVLVDSKPRLGPEEALDCAIANTTIQNGSPALTLLALPQESGGRCL